MRAWQNIDNSDTLQVGMAPRLAETPHAEDSRYKHTRYQHILDMSLVSHSKEADFRYVLGRIPWAAHPLSQSRAINIITRFGECQPSKTFKIPNKTFFYQ